MDSKSEIIGFLKHVQEEIELGSLPAGHVRVLVSDTHDVIGNGVSMRASPSPALVADTIYMCMSMLCSIRDQTLKDYAGDPEVLTAFRSFLADIDSNLMKSQEDSSRVH